MLHYKTLKYVKLKSAYTQAPFANENITEVKWVCMEQEIKLKVQTSNV